MRFVLCLLLSMATPAFAQSSATPWIGIGLERGEQGVRIKQLVDGAPGKRAGLRVGDEVVAIDGVAVHVPEDLVIYVGGRGVGQTVRLSLLREGGKVETKLALEARPDQLALLRDGLVGKKAPRFDLTGFGPHAAKLDALAGNVVVLEFWATWCGPCNSTMPRLTAWQKQYGPRGLRVIGVSTEDAELVRKHIAKKPVGYTIAHDEDEAITGAYLVPAVPTLVVIDKTGVVRYVDVGAGNRLDGVEAAFIALLGR